jgi:hypothetical protein
MAHGGQAKIGRRKSDDHGKRAHKKDKNAVKYNRRDSDPRIVAARAETARAQAELDRIIADQQANPVMGRTDGAVWAKEEAERKLREAWIEEVAVEKSVPEELAFSPEPDDDLEFPDETPKLKVVKEPKLVEVECERVYVKQTHVIDTRELPQSGDGNWRFSYQTARIMLKDGYNIAHVIKYTGIGYEDLNDIPLDEEGYYVDPDSLEGEEE